MEQSNKPHRAAKDSEKSAKKKLHRDGVNHKAFAVANPAKMAKQAQRSAEMKQKRLGPLIHDRTPEEPPPVMVAVMGPKGTGKTTLIKSLVRRYTKHTLTEINGPVTVVTGKRRRVTFFECGTDLNSMIDIAKCADLVLLMIDGNFGFEMETMEFLNILNPHGFPRILGITTHLDLFKNAQTMRTSKKLLKRRFWTEVYQGAKLFYLSGVINGRYPDREILNLARFISIMKFRPLKWRNEHPYLLADRLVDITHPSKIEENPKVDRTVAFFGYLRGSPLAYSQARVHIPGVGDLQVKEVERLNDPCPTPHALRIESKTQVAEGKKKAHRRLDEKNKTIYAPMSDIGGVMIDKDAVYIDVGSSNFVEGQERGVGEKLVTSLQSAGKHLGEQNNQALTIFGGEDDDDEELAEELEELDQEDESELASEIEEVDESHPDFGNTGRTSMRSGRAVAASNDNDDDEQQQQQEEYAFAESDDDLELKWMDNFQKAERRIDLNKLIYSAASSIKSVMATLRGEEEDIEDDDEEDFFKPKKQQAEVKAGVLNYPTELGEWSKPKSVDSISHLFYRELKLKEGQEHESEEEVFDDFEDLEAEGEGESKGKVEVEAKPKIKSVEEQRAESAKRKEELRLQLEENDDREANAVDFENEYTADDAWHEQQKEKIAKQKEVNESVFNEMDDATRDRLEGFRAGTYVRIVFDGIACEFIENFSPKYPMLIGGLLANEDRFGFSQVRIKRHRWHKKILKTNDPIIVSLGWRRFQTCPIYTTSDSRTRNRMLKYSPEHMHCTATFYGPLVSPNTGFCAVNSVSDKDKTPGFRICATGTVQEVDQEVEIVKKLKLVGYPYKVYKNTAFIKEMFSSSLEVAKFEGAQIKTVSGIRGQIKRALAKPEGYFRATFEDKILMSDIIILRAWYPIQVRKWYNPVTSLLLKNKDEWKGMRLTGAVRAANNLETPAPKDSKYGKIERQERKFNPLRVSKGLQSQLPFGSQLHQMKPQRKQTYMQKRAVVVDGEEKKMRDLMIKVATLRNEKDAKRKEKKQQHREKVALEQKKLEERRESRRKEVRKEYFATHDDSRDSKKQKR